MFVLLRKKGMLITRFLDRRTSQVAWSGWHTTMEGVKAELSCVGPPKERKKELGLEMVCYEQHGHSLGTIWHTCAMPDEHEQCQIWQAWVLNTHSTQTDMSWIIQGNMKQCMYFIDWWYALSTPHVPLVPPMLLTPIAPSTLLTAHPTCTACPLTSLTQHHLAYLTCTSCFTSASLTLFVPPNHPTHTVNPTHPTYTTYTAHSYYCANCPFLPVHAPIYSQSSQIFRVCSQQGKQSVWRWVAISEGWVSFGVGKGVFGLVFFVFVGFFRG